MTTTPTTTMLTKNTTELRALVQQHIAADQLVQGTYWDTENHRGCFIGCLNHSSDPAGAADRFGLPIMVQRLAESIFEALPEEEAKAFFAALPDAVSCDGKDLSRVGWQFLAAELRSLPAVPADIQAVIDPVIAGMELLATGQEWIRDAAWAAWDAASYASDASDAASYARDAAGVAARAASDASDASDAASDASDAAWAAWDAAAHARDAAWDAAWAARGARGAAGVAARAASDAAGLRQRDLLLRLIAEAPVVGGGAQSPSESER